MSKCYKCNNEVEGKWICPECSEGKTTKDLFSLLCKKTLDSLGYDNPQMHKMIDEIT